MQRRIHLLFWKCIALSLAAHLLFLFFIYTNPLWVTTWLSPFGNHKSQKGVVYQPPEDLFDGIFDELVVVNASKKVGFDSPNASNLEQQLPVLENPSFIREKFAPPFLPSISIDVQTEGLLLREPPFTTALAQAKLENPNPLISSEKPSSPSKIDLPTLAIKAIKEEEHPPIAKKAEKETTELPSIPYTQQAVESSLQEMAQLYKPAAGTDFAAETEKMHALPHHAVPGIAAKQELALFVQAYGLPNWDKRQNWNHFFSVDIRIMPRKEQEGLYFAVTLNPKPEAHVKAMGQQLHFVIDASKNVEKHRVSLYKRAILRALSYLTDAQSFNIYIVDTHVHALSSTMLEVSKKNLQLARDYLEKDKAGPKGVDVAQNLLSLLQTIDKKAAEEDLYQDLVTVVLMSDGGFLQNKSTGLSAFKQWMKAGPPTFVLYPTTVGSESHPPLFDLLAAASGGKVLHSSTHAAFPRKFAKLLLDLQTPIATKVFPQLASIESDTAISLIGVCCKLAPLYASQPLTLFGVAAQPTSFTLTLDGWHKEFPMEIALDIDLANCREGGLTMRQVVLQDKAEHELSLYLQNGEESHFEQALDWLKDSSEETRKRL